MTCGVKVSKSDFFADMGTYAIDLHQFLYDFILKRNIMMFHPAYFKKLPSDYYCYASNT